MSGRREFLAAGLGAACLAGLPAWSRAQGVDSARVLTATDVHVHDYPTVAAMRWMGEQLELATSGRLCLRVYHGGQLGRESDAIDMARFGAIDIARVYTGALNNAFPLTVALSLPYVFESVTHLRRVVDGDVGAKVLQSFERRGLVGLAIYDSGARSFYNTRRALEVPADLHGLKFRVPASDIFLDMLRLFGANPTPLSYGAVFSALETRLIDGAENNLRSFHSSRQFEIARYWSQSEHSYAPDVLLMSRQSFDSLDPADRELLMDVARRSVMVMRKLWDESESIARQAVLDAGVHFNEVDIPAFRRAVRPLLDQLLRDPEIAVLHQWIRERA